jgi:hypothetical protein
LSPEYDKRRISISILNRVREKKRKKTNTKGESCGRVRECSFSCYNYYNHLKHLVTQLKEIWQQPSCPTA